MSSYIKFVYLFVILSLVLPQVEAQAHETKPKPVLAYNQVAYQALSADNALQNQLWIPSPVRPKIKVVKASAATTYDNDCVVFKTECVCWAKTLTGHYGSWGNGGWRLSGNSGPITGAVIIFYGVHVGVISLGIDDPRFDGTTILYTDRNHDLNGSIRYNVEIAPTDSSIWKFHSF